jgi:hypothetical protein
MGEPITASNGAKLISVDWPSGLNCYSFAARCRNPGGAGKIACLPGAKAGKPITQQFTERALVDACVADGFDYSGWAGGAQPACPETHYLVAVFLDQRQSFHFARQDEKRQWVHKPSAPQDAHNMQGGYILGTDLSNVPWQPFRLLTYLRAPWTGVAVAKGDW